MKALKETLDVLYEDYRRMMENIKHQPTDMDEMFDIDQEEYRKDARKIRHELSIKNGVVADIYGVYASQIDYYLHCLYYEEPEGFAGWPCSTREEMLGWVLENISDGTGIRGDEL